MAETLSHAVPSDGGWAIPETLPAGFARAESRAWLRDDEQKHLRHLRYRLLILTCVAWCMGCGVEARDYSPEVRAAGHAQSGSRSGSDSAAEQAAEEAGPFVWPQPGEQVAVLNVRDHGEIRLELFPELAPQAVASFIDLANKGFYDGTTFHRVVPGFMIQGGDPKSKDDNPKNDGSGGPGYKLEDEFSRAPHLRGVVAMANKGKKNTSGSQFFIVHDDSHFLDGKYTVFARVIEGMDVTDSITDVERDRDGRWGPKDRPLENVVIEAVRIEGDGSEGDASASSQAGAGAEPDEATPAAS